MRRSKFFLILSFLFSFGCLKAQSTKCGEELSNWYLELGNVYYADIILSNMDSSELRENIIEKLENNSLYSNVVVDSENIQFTVSQDIDYQKYGGKKLGLWFGVTVPVTYSGKIEIRDSRFKIKISNIYGRQAAVYALNRLVTPAVTYSFSEDIFNNHGCLKTNPDFYLKSLSIFGMFISDFYQYLGKPVVDILDDDF